MSRPLRIVGYIAIGILTGLLIASIAIWMLTRTDWGMERARLFAVSWLEERVNGELRVGRVTGPGLLGGVVIHDFGIVDTDGRPFLSADSLEVEYDWRTLVSGQIVLNRVILYQPDVAIEKLPGDTAWNYERIFADTTPGDPSSGRSLIMFRDADVRGGTAIVRMALDPADIETPADTARLVIEQIRGGPVRTMRFDRIDADLDRVIWESPTEEGRLFEVSSVSGRGFVWQEPFMIEDGRGTLTMRDSLVTFDFPEVELPASRASILGSVIVGERNDMNIRVDSDNMQFRDLGWLHSNLPEEGGGSLVLRIRTQPEGTLYLAEDARLSTPGTSVSGTFGVVVGETMYFTEVNLRASPLDVDLIERLLPGGLPVDGLLVGTVEVTGPA